MSSFNIVANTSLPGEDVMQGPFYAESVDACAQMCDRQNAMLGGFRNEGAIGTGYSFQHCNGFTFDKLTGACQMKNKAMGNFSDMPQTFHSSQGMVKEPVKGGVRYVSGYRWNSQVNEINDAYPNPAGGVREWPANAAWSDDYYASNGSFCTTGGSRLSEAPFCVENTPGVQTKNREYDVRPGAIISPKNTTTGPFSHNVEGEPISRVTNNMTECSQLCTSMSPWCNAWTFYPNYTSSNMSGNFITDNKQVNGVCLMGNVREPYYQTLTPHDNGAISGFALTSLSNEIHRFLFG